jgi:hypothetical protein
MLLVCYVANTSHVSLYDNLTWWVIRGNDPKESQLQHIHTYRFALIFLTHCSF